MSNENPKVSTFLESLDHPLKPDVIRIRAAVLDSDDRVREQIKWNAPSFRLDGFDDRVTFNLRPQDRVQLVFHRGAKVKDSTSFSFDDTSGLIKWLAPDRGTVTLTPAELSANEPALIALINSWIIATSIP